MSDDLGTDARQLTLARGENIGIGILIVSVTAKTQTLARGQRVPLSRTPDPGRKTHAVPDGPPKVGFPDINDATGIIELISCEPTPTDVGNEIFDDLRPLGAGGRSARDTPGHVEFVLTCTSATADPGCHLN